MMDQVRTISFIGSGNVATHLAVALKTAGFDIREIYSQTFENADVLAKKVDATAIRRIEDLDTVSDLYLVSVPDSSIKAVAGQLQQVEGIVAHTSGISPMNVLEKMTIFGVFYPLQTFSKQRQVDISKVPFCIEASSKETMGHLKKVALRLSPSLFEMGSDQRQYLHLAAVLVNNYSNYLYQVAFDLLETINIDHTVLMPLIKETVSKIKTLHPEDAQTGPARRNDAETIDKHLRILKDNPAYKELYQIFARQLTEKYNEQL
jgi:predicted short-subunit dehydrogenase-like oxidoreductase (DUF2520 family)